MGIFADQKSKTFTYYHVRLEMRNRIIGGVPRDPKIIEGWLRARAGISQEDELRRKMLQTVKEIGAEIPENPTDEELTEAIEKIAGEKSTIGFKRDEKGPYIESRQLKAMLKENTNILFAGERWGKTGKGPKSFLAERVFVEHDRIHLGVKDISGVDLFIGHTSGPKGPQSNLTYIEYVDNAVLTFNLMVLHDSIKAKDWPEIWNLAEENGLGALRSQGFGRFDIMQFDSDKRTLSSEEADQIDEIEEVEAAGGDYHREVTVQRAREQAGVH